MNLKKNKCLVFMLTIAIIFSIFNVEYIFINNNINNHNENNFNKYYIAKEIINVIDEINNKEYNNFQAYRFISKIISNSYDKHIGRTISNASNIYKLKYTAVINQIFNICNDCVVVVVYIHKKDGKKQVYC